MDDLRIRQGETLEITVTSDELNATSVRFVARKGDATPIIDETELFTTVDGERVATISTNDTNHAVDEYEYMLTITYDDGFVDKLPDASQCDDDCDLPILAICEAIDLQVS